MGLFRLPHAPAFTQATNVLMFVQSMKFIETHSGRNDNVFIFGQKSNLDTWKMAKINMAIRGIEANLGGSEGYLRHRLAGVVALRVHHGPLQPVELGRKIWWMPRVHSLLDSKIN